LNAVNRDYLDRHKKFRLDNKKLATAFIVLSLVIAIIVFWWLKLVGITVTGEAFCGLEEHTHSVDCYVQQLICDYSQETTAENETTAEDATTEDNETTASGTLPSEEDVSAEGTSQEEFPEGISEETTEESAAYEELSVQTHTHTHSNECYEKTLVCTETEHTHTADCFPDKTADVETVSDWLDTIESVKITNNIPENLVAIAMTQAGYEESKNNFEYDSEGNKNGYTRYGEWYGNPYGKWNAMFVSFCLHYANINNVDELKSAGAEAMRLAWQGRYAYSSADVYTGERGDLVFFDTDGDKAADTVGIVIAVGDENITVISGDSNNKVETTYMELSENVIGYGLTGELHFAKDTEYDEESTQTITEPEELTEYNAPILMMSDLSEQSDATEPQITYINDLTSVVKSVSFQTLEGEIVDENSTIYLGQTYVISMEFAEKNTGDEWIQFKHDEDHHLHYQIPENIHCEPFTEWHSITAKTENGTIEDVGEYFIRDDGLLIVVFKDDPVTGECFGSKYSNVDFFIEFNATVGTTQTGSSAEVVFNDEIKVNLNIDTTAEMQVSKTHGAYNGKENTLEYQIRIEATKAVIKDLVVPDDIWEKHHALKDTIVVTDLDGNVLDPQPTISEGSYGNYGFTLTGFPDFAAGEGFLINYKASINDDLLTQDSVGLWNGVYPYGKDATGAPVNGSAEDWAVVELNKIEKDGKQSVIEKDDGTIVPVIEWEIEIKKSDSNLEGTVIIDTLGDGLAYYTDESIRIKRYDQWGNRINDISLSWDNVDVNNNSMSFELPEGYRFVIVYYTTYEELRDGEMKHYTNTAKVTINQREEVAGGEADVVGFVPNIRKSASGNDGEYIYFTIEADIPAVIKDWGGFFLTDLAAFWGYNGNSEGYLYVENMPEDLVITAVTESGQTVSFTPYVAGGTTENTYILVAPAEGNQYHSFNIYFNTSQADSDSSKWILSENSKLTITYKIPFDAGTGVEWTGELKGENTLEDVLLQNYAMANEAYLNFTDIIQATGVSTYKYAPTITKKSVVNDDGTIDYTVVFHNTIPGSGGNQGYLTSAYSITFNDTFDEKLEYVGGSLMVTCYDPWNDAVWYNKYVYDGMVSGNTMSIQANEFDLSQTNSDLPSATIGWISPFTDYQKYCNQIGAGGKHVFTYKLKLKDEYLNTTEENKFVLDNTAELKWNADNSSGPVTDTVEIKTGLLDKQVVQEDNRLNFDIHINRNALDILVGADTLTIEDTMTENLSVYWDSIKLFYEDKNGNWIDFDSADSVYSYTVTYDQHVNRLTFVVPDSLHIRIDYTTLITQSGFVSVNNAVKVDGKAQVTDIIDAVFKVEQHSGGASGSINNITLLKQDGDTDVPLSDVTFLLYGPVGDPNAVVPTGAQNTILTDAGKTLRYIGSYITGADGTVKIQTQYLTFGGPYALVETHAPTGYNKLEKPVYFYYYEADPNGIIQTVTTIIAVENYTYGFVLPETGGTGRLPLTIIGFALMATPLLYSTIRRKREGRLTQSP